MPRRKKPGPAKLPWERALTPESDEIVRVHERTDEPPSGEEMADEIARSVGEGEVEFEPESEEASLAEHFDPAVSHDYPKRDEVSPNYVERHGGAPLEEEE